MSSALLNLVLFIVKCGILDSYSDLAPKKPDLAVSKESKKEQKVAGLHQITNQQRDDLIELNAK